MFKILLVRLTQQKQNFVCQVQNDRTFTSIYKIMYKKWQFKMEEIGNTFIEYIITGIEQI